MHHRTEVDIALLGYAIQIEREAQYKKQEVAYRQISGFKRHQRFSGDGLQGNIESANLKTKK